MPQFQMRRNDGSSPTVPSVRSEYLALLEDIGRNLDETMNLKDVLEPVVRALVQRTALRRASLTFLRRDAGQIVTEEAFGYSETERERGRYRIGEGVTGQVVQTGDASVVPKISEAAEFLFRRKTREDFEGDELSFICVPIKLRTDVVGTLSAQRPWEPDAPIEEERRLLSIVASLVAQAVRHRQEAEEEKSAARDLAVGRPRRTPERFRPDDIVGNSKAMLEIFELMGQVAATDTTVLVRGESGTGKELIADALHRNSDRVDGPLVKVNCGALPENLVESELFGHEEGAFTGADQSRTGRFELADGGTIFLDEVGDVPEPLQVKLLRVLQEGTIQRVGSSETRRVDVRVLAATNRDLEQMLESGAFRDDLYYRLNVFPIRVPPLRERKSDVLLLADHFVEKHADANDKEIRRISTPAIDMLHAYHWPGNVRELENCIERAVLLSTDGVIHGHHLPPSLQTAEATGTEFEGDLESALDSLERELVVDALKSTRGNQAAAARRLGVTPRVLRLRVDKHDIDPKRFKTD